MTINKAFTQRALLLFAIFWMTSGILSSCSAHKNTVVISNTNEELSYRLGMKVTADDNIELYRMVSEWIGTPHRLGRSSKKGTDCSGFVTMIYQKIYGKKLARSSASMLTTNCEKIDKDSLREGDLVFFHTRRKSKRPSHVGIYLKDGKFAHASTSNGVIISDLDEPYYKKRWITGGIVK